MPYVPLNRIILNSTTELYLAGQGDGRSAHNGTVY